MTRQRPPQDQGKEIDSLDEIEQRAKARIKESGQRAPLAGKLKLEWADQEEGFHYFWASDAESTPIPIQDLLESSYEFVRYKHGVHASEKVIKNSKGCKLYLMRITVELHEENMRLQRATIDEVEKNLHEVGVREYGGDSKELGKGTPIAAGYTKSPLFTQAE